MRTMRPLCVLAAYALSVCLAYGQMQSRDSKIGRKDPLQSVHRALFSSFLPADQLARDSHTQSLLLNVRDRMWSSRGNSPGFRQLLAPFENLETFGGACGLHEYLRTGEQESFSDLTAAKRKHILFLLESCPENEPRRITEAVRNLYLISTYGLLQGSLAKVQLNQTAPRDWIYEHRPVLPPTRLRFDHEKHEISSIDGPIDYLIVGSGPAGSVLAQELRRGGKHALLVERGSFLEPGSIQTRSNPAYIDTRTTDDGAILISNGVGIGGGSEVNIDLCFSPTSPPIQARIDAWRRQGLIGATEFNAEELARAYAWVKASVGTRSISKSEINRNNRVLWDGALREGLHPKLYDLNTYAPGRSPYPVTDKRSSEQLVMDALQNSKNPLSMIPDAEVLKVLFEDKGGNRQAVGVEVRMRSPALADGVIADPNGFRASEGERAVIRAKTVILSAGSLGSPAILLRSGIANNQIGRGVILHPSMPIIGEFNQPINALEGTEASVYVDDNLVNRGYAFEAMSADPVYVALMSPGPAMDTFDMVRNFHYLAGFGVMLIDSVSPRNRLFLDRAGKVHIQYLLSDADKARFRKGIAEAVRVMFLAGAKKVYLPSTEDILHNPPGGELQPVVLTNIEQADRIEKNLEFIPNRTILTSAHMQATDKMGDNSNDSVVAHDFHVWGTRALYVVDGSIFPTSVGANPMQSIYTFAKIFADRMNREMAVKQPVTTARKSLYEQQFR